MAKTWRREIQDPQISSQIQSFSRSLDNNLALLDATWRFLALLDASQRYSTLLDATRRYLTLLDAAQRCSTLLNAAQRCSTLLNAAQRCSTLFDATCVSGRGEGRPPPQWSWLVGKLFSIDCASDAALSAGQDATISKNWKKSLVNCSLLIVLQTRRSLQVDIQQSAKTEKSPW
jgi:hypothetical protein